MDYNENKRLIENSNQILKLINKYCINLKKISFCFNGIDIEIIENFCKIFGQTLESVSFGIIADINKPLILKMCPNIKTLKNIRIDELIDKNDNIIFGKLQDYTIEMNYGPKDDVVIDKFINNYKLQLKSITTSTTNISLTEFKNLIKLNINYSFNFNPINFIDYFDSIGNQCTKLESLELKYFDIPSVVLQTISKFINLKSLSLISDLLGEQNCAHLKGCIHLSQLRITGNIRDEFFIDVNQHLPELREIEIFNRVSDQITGNCLVSFSKLVNLKKLYIVLLKSDLEVIDCQFIQLINSCEKLESIQVNEVINISSTAVNTLHTIAWNRPKTAFRLKLRLNDCVFQYLNSLTDKPKNVDFEANFIV